MEPCEAVVKEGRGRGACRGGGGGGDVGVKGEVVVLAHSHAKGGRAKEGRHAFTMPNKERVDRSSTIKSRSAESSTLMLWHRHRQADCGGTDMFLVARQVPMTARL